MLWYLFQLTVVACIIYVYADIPHPNETNGHVIFLGFIVAYCLTWLISKTYWSLLWLISYWTRYRTTQQTQRRRYIDHSTR